MNFDSDPADDVFRADVRQFIADTLAELVPDADRPEATARLYEKSLIQQWTRRLNAKGLLVPHWPEEWGGARWPANWRSILEAELSCVRCPPTDAIGTDFVGPVLCAFGSPDQKRRYLPAIRNGEQFWCQGFSEPQAGSDVMSLRSTATTDKGNFIINGHKLWTSNAHKADMMFALLRIETPGARRQQGLSFVLIDMRSPGITVRPVILIDGIRRVNEVLLENVRVPQTNLVGDPGKGWVYARYLLTNERKIIAGLGSIKTLLANLRKVAASADSTGTLNDPRIAMRVSEFESELTALELMELRLLHARDDDSVSQVLAPILKLRGCELRQRITDLTLQLIGERALELPVFDVPAKDAPPDPSVIEATIGYLFQRSATLAGGTSEIQRNLIAGVALQL